MKYFSWLLLLLIGSSSIVAKDKHQISSNKSTLQALVLVEQDNWPYLSFNIQEEKAELLQAVNYSISYLDRSASKYHYPKQGFSHKRVRRSLVHFKKLLMSEISCDELNEILKEEFDLYQSIGQKGEKKVLFTGYFEPIFKGSLTATNSYQYPVYQLPEDLIIDKNGKILGRKTEEGEIVPYWNRHEIDQEKVLKDKGLELVYLEDLFDVYMIHLQGSGAIELPNGKLFRIGYNGKNSREFFNYSIAKELKNDGKLQDKQLTPKGIRAYFNQFPDELQAYLSRNPSYVFFREKIEGPFGCLAVPLTAGYSLSTDKKIFPKAGLCFVDVTIPRKNEKNKIEYVSYKRFVLDQDTGGAMRGAGRCEIYFGSGDSAGEIAGGVFSKGSLYYLFLKEELVNQQD